MAASSQRPNVLFITTDQQRYDTLGVTGNPHVRTPNLDALARRGTMFTHGCIQGTVCIPSRASLMTGRYVHQHGVSYMEEVIGTTPGLPPWEVTIQERLREHGYTTAAYGKVHQIPPKGWDETALTMGKGARWTVAHGSPLGPSQLGPVYERWLEAKRPGAYEQIYEQRRRPEYRENQSAIVNVLAADEYVDYWIGENTWKYLERPEAGKEQPFFLWCGFCGPHGPFDPPEPYASMYDQSKIPLPELLHARQKNVPGEADRKSRWDREGGEELIRKVIAYYWGMMTFIDDMTGRIMDVMTQRGLWENTLVIFTTDHGEMLGDFGRGGKGNFSEQVIRPPYIVVPPGSEARDEVRAAHGQVEHIDLVPTIMDYAGLAQPRELPGMSLRPALETDEGAAQWEGKEGVLCDNVDNGQRRRQKCLRTARYKYAITTAKDADAPFVEFYDLEKDPQELVNVAGDAAYAAEVRRHSELLLERLMVTEKNAWNSGGSLAAVADEEHDHWGQRIK
jgi:arylsulfatase